MLVLDTPERLKDTIGEGDLLEIELPEAAGEEVNALRRALPPSLPEPAWQMGKLRLVGRDVHHALPVVLDHLRQAGLTFGEVVVRRRTLEDVFIALTGRGLRG